MKKKFYLRGETLKKINEVETIWEFGDLLAELANKNPALYAPLCLHYQLLLQRHKTIMRIVMIFMFVAGIVVGWGAREVI